MDFNLGEMMRYGHYEHIFILYFNMLRLRKNVRLFVIRCQNQQAYNQTAHCLDVKMSLFLTKYSK